MDLITLEYTEQNNGKAEKKSLKFSKDLLKPSYKEASLFVIKVDGESMQPLINDKALVVADLSQLDIVNDDIYLVYHDNKMWIKQAIRDNGTITFVSINKDFSHLVYAHKDVRVVARAILTFTNL